VPKGTKEDLLVKSSFVPPDGPMALGALTGPLRMAEATGTSSVKMLASPPSPTPVLSLLPSTPVSGAAGLSTKPSSTLVSGKLSGTPSLLRSVRAGRFGVIFPN